MRKLLIRCSSDSCHSAELIAKFREVDNTRSLLKRGGERSFRVSANTRADSLDARTAHRVAGGQLALFDEDDESGHDVESEEPFGQDLVEALEPD